MAPPCPEGQTIRECEEYTQYRLSGCVADTVSSTGAIWPRRCLILLMKSIRRTRGTGTLMHTRPIGPGTEEAGKVDVERGCGFGDGPEADKKRRRE